MGIKKGNRDYGMFWISSKGSYNRLADVLKKEPSRGFEEVDIGVRFGWEEVPLRLKRNGIYTVSDRSFTFDHLPVFDCEIYDNLIAELVKPLGVKVSDNYELYIQSNKRNLKRNIKKLVKAMNRAMYFFKFGELGELKEIRDKCSLL